MPLFLEILWGTDSVTPHRQMQVAKIARTIDKLRTILMKQARKAISTAAERLGRPQSPRDLLMWPTFAASGLFLLFIALFAVPRSRVLVLFLGVPVIAVGALIPIAFSCFIAAASLRER